MENKENENMEQWNDVNKKSPAGTIIIIILLLVIAGLGFFIYQNKDKLFGEKEKQQQEQQEEKETNKQEEDVVIQPLDLTKCLNCTNDSLKFSDAKELTPNNSIGNEQSGIISISKEKITFNWDSFNSLGLKRDGEGTINYNHNIKKTIENAYLGGKGQDITSTIACFLLEDGTVQYVNLFKQEDSEFVINTTDNIFECASSEAKAVVAIYSVNAYVENGGGYSETIGATADGSFYIIK